jgi:hypothetical protein
LATMPHLELNDTIVQVLRRAGIWTPPEPQPQ